jgi:hypothetical protein
MDYAEFPQQPTESVQSATPATEIYETNQPDSSRWIETEEDRQLIDKFDRRSPEQSHEEFKKRGHERSV